MAKQKVKVGQEVKECPVCGATHVEFPVLLTLEELRKAKRIRLWCYNQNCDVEFWFYPAERKITFKCK